MAPAPPETAEKLRADKWLWHARFFRTRGLAAALAGSGRLRINGERALKPAQPVRPGDVLTFPQGRRIRVVRIRALGTRRGPAAEAAALYDDLEPAGAAVRAVAERGPGSGRPSKKARRKIDALDRDLP
jgi:ribosome-associated heat shock protein Hsp15